MERESFSIWSKPMKNLWRLSEPQNHRCCYCTHPMIRHRHKDGVPTPPTAITREHYIPRVHGGQNGDNLIAACYLCNLMRGDMDAHAFYTKLHRLFARNPQLKRNWHSLDKYELRTIRRVLLDTEERRLRGLAVSYVEFAWLHIRHIKKYGHELRT